MKKFVPIAALLMLTACVSPEQQAELRRQQLDDDAQTCLNYGLNPRSEAFANCRMELDIARQNRAALYYNQPRYSVGYGYGRSRHFSHAGYYW